MVKPNWIVDSVAANKLLSCKFMDLFLHLPFFLKFYGSTTPYHQVPFRSCILMHGTFVLNATDSVMETLD